MNSFVSNAAKVRTVHRGMAKACDPLLRAIPQDADLRSQDSLSPVLDLLAAAMETKWILLPVATKVLHRKRPALIPMMDFVVTRHYLVPLGHRDLLYRAAGGNRSASRLAPETCMNGFRNDLRTVEEEIESLRAGLVQDGYGLTAVRLLEILVWTETEDRAYYR